MENIKEQLEEVIKKLGKYTEHSRDCIISQFEAGEPTKDGGYRQKFNGKWYQSKPIDKTPKCDCGLNDTLSLIADEVLKVVVEKLEKVFDKHCNYSPKKIESEEEFEFNKGLIAEARLLKFEIINLLTNSSTLEQECNDYLSPNKENKNNG